MAGTSETARQLRREIKEREKLLTLLDSHAEHNRLSPAARERISAAAKLRWVNWRKAKWAKENGHAVDG